MKRPLTVAGAVVFLSLYFLWSFPLAAPLLCAAGGLAALVSALLYRKIKLKRLLAVSVLVLISCLLFSGARYFVYQPAVRLAGYPARLTAHTQSLPERRYGRYDYTFETDEVNGQELHTRVTVRSYEELDFEPYDTVEMTANLVLEDAIGADKVFLSAEDVVILSVTPYVGSKPLSHFVYQFRTRLANQISTNLSAENGGLLNGLLLGDQSGVSTDIANDFRYTGISHLLSVSGLHMSVWAMTVFALLKRTRIGRRSASLLTIAFVLFFMALTSFAPSVVRSGVMMLFYLGAFLFKRTPDSLNALGGAVLLFLIINPFAAVDISLILSALATFGMIVLSPAASRLIKRMEGISFVPARRLLRWLTESLFVSVSASVFTIPVTLTTFGTLPILTPVANLLIAIWGAPAMVAGGVSALFGMFGISGLAQFGFAFSGIVLQWMIRLSNAFADIPYITYYFELEPAVSGLVMAVLAAVILWIVLWDCRKKPVVVLVGTMACILAVSAGYQYVRELDEAVLRVVGGSNPCVFIQYGGQRVLIGSGAQGNGMELLERQNLYRVDFLYLWSDDLDTERAAVLERCRDVAPVIQGGAFYAEFEDGMTIESDGSTLLVSVNGRTIRIAENLKEDPADILIAGGLAKNIDYSSRPAVETNTRYAKGKNALTVPYNGDIIVTIDQNAQITLNGG